MKRPIFLTIWLILIAVNHLYSIYTYTLGTAALPVLANRPVWYYPVMIALSLIALASVYLIWTWKKMGFYLMIGIAVVSFLVSLTMVSPLAAALSVIFLAVGVGILYLAMKPVWKNFK